METFGVPDARAEIRKMIGISRAGKIIGDLGMDIFPSENLAAQ
jgi:hypothetical protein